jgi:hypothetical protein
MNATASHNPADRFAITFEEMRETMAAEGTRKGLAGALQAAILRLLNALVALLAALRDGKLAAAAPASATCAASAEPATEGFRGTRAANGERHRDLRAEVATVPPAACGDAGADRSGAAPGARNPRAAPPDAASARTAGGVAVTATGAGGAQTLIEPPSAFVAGGSCIQATPHRRYAAPPITLLLRGRMVPLAESDSKIGLEEAQRSCVHLVTR